MNSFLKFFFAGAIYILLYLFQIKLCFSVSWQFHHDTQRHKASRWRL